MPTGDRWIDEVLPRAQTFIRDTDLGLDSTKAFDRIGTEYENEVTVTISSLSTLIRQVQNDERLAPGSVDPMKHVGDFLQAISDLSFTSNVPE